MVQNQKVIIPLPCPRCHLKSAFQINNGKKGYCFNCKYNWKLRWKGGKVYSNPGELI